MRKELLVPVIVAPFEGLKEPVPTINHLEVQGLYAIYRCKEIVQIVMSIRVWSKKTEGKMCKV
jgi:hypothetical protein